MTLHEMKQDLVRYGDILNILDTEDFEGYTRECHIKYEGDVYIAKMRNGVTYSIEMVLEN